MPVAPRPTPAPTAPTALPDTAAAPPEARRAFAALAKVHAVLPPGWKSELSSTPAGADARRTVVLLPPPVGLRQCNLLAVRRQLDAHAPANLRPSENTDLVALDAGLSRNPALVYLPETGLDLTSPQTPAHAAALVVEVTAPTPAEAANDTDAKVRDYPRMGIPLYLLVDARKCSATLFSRPEAGAYRRREDVEFGRTLRIPAPFSFDLATDRLLPY